MNLLPLLRDCTDMMRLRYRDDAAAYRYDAPVFFLIIVALGALHAATLAPLFGSDMAVFAFAVVVAAVRWLVLTRAMTAVLHYFGSPQIPFLGYTLAGEALALPTVFFFYLPPAAGLIANAWLLWAFWAQTAGFMALSKQSLGKVLLGYIVYLLGSAVITYIFFTLFLAAGWLDADTLQKNLETFLQLLQAER